MTLLNKLNAFINKPRFRHWICEEKSSGFGGWGEKYYYVARVGNNPDWMIGPGEEGTLLGRVWVGNSHDGSRPWYMIDISDVAAEDWRESLRKQLPNVAEKLAHAELNGREL